MFQPKIYRYLTNLTSEADAADLTQTVFLKVSQAFGDFRGEASLSTWIYRIATNTAHDHAASSTVKQNRLEKMADDASVDEHPDLDSAGTDHEYIRREMNACIRGVVEQLPENYRTVLLLSDFEELSNAEIASVLQISIDTVKIRLHRGRTALKKALECQCTFYHDERSNLMCDRKSE
ncbi:RNA polymerase sigma-H factor [Geobacter sp. SVR]|nr:RNA polymerase sigma-H factor [Geobacter sp. SVR]